MPYSRRLFLASSLLLVAAARAQSPVEARLKARLAFTLARFTQWPASAFAGPADALTICVLHRDAALGEAFAELAGQTVAGRPIKVVGNPDKALSACHVLFVHETVDRSAAGALDALAATPVLTIGDAEGFSAGGGMVELVNVNDALRMDVNLKALRTARLGLSSQVLKLARHVRE